MQTPALIDNACVDLEMPVFAEFDALLTNKSHCLYLTK